MNKVVVFLKNPANSNVKTRLAAGIGAKKAADVYRWLIGKTLDALDPVPGEIHLYFDSEGWTTGNSMFHIHLQSGSDLGQRMRNAIGEQVEGDRNVKVVLIGSDCPEMNSDVLFRAFQLLDTKELVIGPANDGGFYLIGMKKLPDGIFDTISWSSEQVLQQLIVNARKLKLDFALIDYLDDVDDARDFIRYEAEYEQYIYNVKIIGKED